MNVTHYIVVFLATFSQLHHDDTQCGQLLPQADGGQEPICIDIDNTEDVQSQPWPVCGSRATRINVRQHQCETCGKTFYWPSELTRHMSVHTGIKPYVCNVCGKAYAQPRHLVEHVRVHMGHELYVCKMCGMAFVRHSILLNHMKTHTDNKPRPHVCSECGWAFTRRGRLTKHMAKHTANGDTIAR